MPTPIRSTELVPINSSSVSFTKRKRQKRRSKRFKKFLYLSLLICLLGALFENLDKIRTLSFFQEVENVTTNQITPTITSSQAIEPEVTKEKYCFISTSPIKSEFINQTDLVVDPTIYSYAFPKVEEIYNEYGNNAAVVLIVHFTPSEAFSTTNGYSENSLFYNNENNISQIGKEICQSLNENGINAIHVADYNYSGDKINGRYMYEKTIEKVLNDNPSISYILDISRDLTINQDMTMYKETVNISGVDCPTISLICGTNNESLNENSIKNIAFMNELSTFLNDKANLLVSKQFISPYVLSQKFETPTLRVNIGSFSCNYKEASICASLFANLLSEYLK